MDSSFRKTENQKGMFLVIFFFFSPLRSFSFFFCSPSSFPESHGPFNSVAQERLYALLLRASEVLPFASNDDCDEVFDALADFCLASSASKRERSAGKFAKLSIEELIALGPDQSLLNRKRPKLSGVENKEQKEEKVETRREGDGGDDNLVTKWRFELAYNVVSVSSVQAEPLSITLLARPPVAGNQKPILYVMDLHDLNSVEVRRGRQGTKLRNTLLNALRDYAETCRLPDNLIARLKTFEWSKPLIEASLTALEKN